MRKYVDFDHRGSSAQWGIAIDRFVDPWWFNHSIQKARFDHTITNGPLVLANETELAMGPTKLLLRLLLRENYYQDKIDEIEITCDIAQRYVESRVDCSHLDERRTCKVVAQRPSQKAHTLETITQLSFPRAFNDISRELPTATGRVLGSRNVTNVLDQSLYYLHDPMFERMTQGPSMNINNIDLQTIGPRFGQLLNTYLGISQLPLGDLQEAFIPNVTTEGVVATYSEVFMVSKVWVGLCVISTLVLLACGCFSVLFVHLASGPEILGYVSTMARNSRYITLSPKTTWMDGPELAKETKSLWIKHGLVFGEVAEEAVLAIAAEDKTEGIGKQGLHC